MLSKEYKTKSVSRWKSKTTSNHVKATQGDDKGKAKLHGEGFCQLCLSYYQDFVKNPNTQVGCVKVINFCQSKQAKQIVNDHHINWIFQPFKDL